MNNDYINSEITCCYCEARREKVLPSDIVYIGEVTEKCPDCDTERLHEVDVKKETLIL